MSGLSVWQLARLAECADPDGLDSPGAQWLELVRDALDDDADRDGLAELADSLVPVYTHERWQVFVDLAAYQEDVTDLGAEADDLTGCAGVALYMIAERLLAALLADRDETTDDVDAS